MAATDTARTDAGDAYARYRDLFADLDAPFAFVDLDAMWSNADEMLARAQAKPIRVASKSVRCRDLLDRILGRDERFRGLMTFTLAETLWLHGHGHRDLLLAYPTADREALRELGRLEGDGRPIVMIDSVEHLDVIAAAAGSPSAPIRTCIEFDTGYRLPGGKIVGPKRSPLREPSEVAALAGAIAGREGVELAGIMGYEGHIAGVGDQPLEKALQGPVIRRMQSASAKELAERRAAVVEAVQRVTPIELVNGGGTGSLHTTAAEAAVTEVTAGSGFYAPTLFDRYSAFDLTPAAMFALPVVRRPGPRVVTLLGGGYHASGPAGRDRLPSPHLPQGLELDGMEGAGEVQTPVRGDIADTLDVGDHVFMRHAKAGELCERFDTLHLVEAGERAGEVPTYRGEGQAFL